MQLQEVSHNLQETKCNCRRLQTLLFYTSGDLRKCKTICGKPPEMYGSLPQLAGNQRRSTEVLRNLWETQCSFQGLFGNRNGELVFLLLDVHGFSFSETQRIKPFSLKPDFRDGDHLTVAFLVSCMNFNFSGIHHGAVFRFFYRL